MLNVLHVVAESANRPEDGSASLVTMTGATSTTCSLAEEEAEKLREEAAPAFAFFLPIVEDEQPDDPEPAFFLCLLGFARK